MKQIKLIGLVLILIIIPISTALTFNKVTEINLEYDKITETSSSGWNQTYVDNIMPIGSITAFAYSLSGVPAIPSNWKICDGSVIVGGVMNGTNSPNLISRFLYGGTTSGVIGGTSIHSHDYSGTTGTPSDTVIASAVATVRAGSDRHTHTYSGKTDSTSTMPPYYTVVWIMRIY